MDLPRPSTKRFARIALYAATIPLLLIAFAARALEAQNFTVAPSPQTLTIHPGDQNVPLKVSIGSSSYAGPISIALKGLPSGITTAPLSLNAGSSGTLLVSASMSADQAAFSPPSSPNSHSTAVTLVALAGTSQATAQLTLTVSLSNPSFAPKAGDIDLPIVKIDTNGVPILNKDDDIPGTITITSADGRTTYLPSAADSDNTATFHLHGHTTLTMPKVPYKVKLDKSFDLLHAMGLACPYVTSSGVPTCDKSKSYILLANYDDKTLLRDWSASALANAIPIGGGYLDSPAGSPTPSGTNTLMPWAPHSLFVALYVNGAYEGTYQLIEQVKVDSHRVNIHELSESDTAPADVTGGYLMEIDHHEEEAFVFHTPQGLPIGLKNPDFSPDPEIPEQTSYISNYVDQAENALYSPHFTDPSTGWRAYFDEASVVNFYIVNDVMGNVDGGDFNSSVYLYKDKGNPLLYMGPIWDFDVSSGNVNYEPIANPTVPWMRTNAAWYNRLFMDPGFKRDVADQFGKLESNGVFTSWLSSIQQEANNLQQAQINNFTRWPMLGIRVWPNPEAAGSYSGELAYLLNYLRLRIAYLDSVLNSKAATTTTMSLSSSTVKSGALVTLKAVVTGGKSPSGTVSFLVTQPVLAGMPNISAPLDGTGNADATVTDLPSGHYALEAIYSGDGQNALSASTPVSITVEPPPAESTTSIASSTPSIKSGESIAFTAAVIGASGTTTPTGTVAFTSNGVKLGTVALNSAGTLTFSTTSLPSGDNSVEASYSGGNNYLPSSSPSFDVTVAPPPLPPTFNLTASPSSATVEAGSSASITLTITPQNGFNQKVSFSCSGLPTEDQCAFSPESVTPSGTLITTSLTISTSNLSQTAAAGSGNNPMGGSHSGRWASLGGIVFAFLIWPLRRRRKWPLMVVLAAVMTGIGASGCGTSTKAAPPPDNYSVVITASGGSISQAVTLPLQVTD